MIPREFNREELEDQIEPLVRQVKEELIRAIDIWGIGPSFHENYGVLKEEFDEFWDEVKRHDQDITSIYQEAKQTAAMAVRAMLLANWGPVKPGKKR